MPAVVALPLGLTVAILQYRLYDLDLFIHRGVVWLVLSALAVAVYAVAVALGERMLADRGSFAARAGGRSPGGGDPAAGRALRCNGPCPAAVRPP